MNHFIYSIYFGSILYLIFLGYDLIYSTDANLRVENQSRVYEKQIPQQDGLLFDPRVNLIEIELKKRFFAFNPHTMTLNQQKEYFIHHTDSKYLQSLQTHLSKNIPLPQTCEDFKDLIQKQYPQSIASFKSFYQHQLYLNLTHQPLDPHQIVSKMTVDEYIKKLDDNLVFYPKSSVFNAQIDQMNCDHPLLSLKDLSSDTLNDRLILYFYAPWLSINRYLLETIVFIPFLGTKMIYGHQLLDPSQDHALLGLMPILQSLKTRRW